MKEYQVNEIFYSVQGEGMRAGEASVFVRLAHCNLECTVEPGPKSPGGFDCDTEFESAVRMTAVQIVAEIKNVMVAASPIPNCDWVVLTGGEPGLQVDSLLCSNIRKAGFNIAIETNGSILLANVLEQRDPAKLAPVELEWILNQFPFDWITVSPKVAEHAIKQLWAHEVKYVRGYGQNVPETHVRARHSLISPAFDGMHVQERTLRWCQQLVLQNPQWRLSVQTHKAGGGIR